MHPLGRPVVPEVNAMSATSSAAVSTASYRSGIPSARRSRSSGASPPYVMTRSPGTSALTSSSTDLMSHSAWLTRAISHIVASSRARCCASTVTATAPAFSTASQHAASQGVVGPRSMTRFPGTTPSSEVSTCAIRSTRVRS